MSKVQNIPYLLIIGLCSLYSMYVVTHFLMFLGIDEKVAMGVSIVIAYITHSIIFDTAKTIFATKKFSSNIILALTFCASIVVMEYYGLNHKIRTSEVDNTKVEVLGAQLVNLRNQLSQTGVSNHYAKVELRRSLKVQIKEIQAEIKGAKLELANQKETADAKTEMFSFYSIIVLVLSILASIEVTKGIDNKEFKLDSTSLSQEMKQEGNLNFKLENKNNQHQIRSNQSIGFSFNAGTKEERLYQAWEGGERNIAKLCKMVKSNPVLIKQMISDLRLSDRLSS
ncbi:hypothetical protein [Flammeovirga kamogawensis]|uniref:DUF4407 domain-containing protein n=1 Tax=Flammeovirga kamogawensis TaxID=373891 RepID=A0ABX8H4G1_9BACT|nr:hypothetical protein [Flammeovirga kamogawensis]MBB6463877.1 hypothetical protein [Flammeovirga kamogawensis]QWG10798.1 hypothetical protein KM029_26700 [Flammeovirga kamogawensis]TRX63215.1 hypothetical protein EO216_26530 [Flammeovirga kamogawensis]